MTEPIKQYINCFVAVSPVKKQQIIQGKCPHMIEAGENSRLTGCFHQPLSYEDIYPELSAAFWQDLQQQSSLCIA